MRKQFGLMAPVSVFYIIILFLTSCSGTNSAPPPSDSIKAMAGDTTVKAVTPKNMLSGDLDNLWITVDLFNKLSSKVTFRFFIDVSGNLTLNGWSKDDGQYNDALPDVILNNGSASGLQYGPGNYFGNLQLSPKDITYVQKLIKKTKPTPTYVEFAPVPPANYAGQINYNIVLTTAQPVYATDTTKSRVNTPTTAYTNPSPPKNSVQ